MIVELTGYRKLDFTAQDGSVVKGTQLFISFSDEDVVGSKTEKVFIRDGMPLPAGMKPGDAISIEFDMKGKVVDISGID